MEAPVIFMDHFLSCCPLPWQGGGDKQSSGAQQWMRKCERDKGAASSNWSFEASCLHMQAVKYLIWCMFCTNMLNYKELDYLKCIIYVMFMYSVCVCWLALLSSAKRAHNSHKIFCSSHVLSGAPVRCINHFGSH